MSATQTRTPFSRRTVAIAVASAVAIGGTIFPRQLHKQNTATQLQ